VSPPPQAPHLSIDTCARRSRAMTAGFADPTITWHGPARVAADRARSEASVQALCGLMEVHGRDRDSPSRLGLKVASVAAGLLAAQATQRCTLAELRRVASGSGVSLTPLRGYTEVLAEAPTCRRRRCAQGTASDRPTPASWRTGAEPTAGGGLPLAGVRVVDAAVVGLPHPVLGEDVAAAVVGVGHVGAGAAGRGPGPPGRAQGAPPGGAGRPPTPLHIGQGRQGRGARPACRRGTRSRVRRRPHRDRGGGGLGMGGGAGPLPRRGARRLLRPRWPLARCGPDRRPPPGCLCGRRPGGRGLRVAHAGRARSGGG